MKAGVLFALFGSALAIAACGGSGAKQDGSRDVAQDAGGGDTDDSDGPAGDAADGSGGDGDATIDVAPGDASGGDAADAPVERADDGGGSDTSSDGITNDATAPDSGRDAAPAGRWSTLRLLAGGLGGVGTANDVGVNARFHSPFGVAVDGAGNLYVSDSINHAIRQWTAATGAVTTLAGSPGVAGNAVGRGVDARFRGPNGLALDGAGNLFVADTGNDVIRKIVLASATVTTFAGSAGNPGSVDAAGAAARLNAPVGLTWDGSGNLYFTDEANATIRKLELATAMVTTLAGTPGNPGSADGTGAAARFEFPRGLALDGNGNLFISDAFDSTIRKLVLATGEVTTFAGMRGMTTGGDGIGTAAGFSNPVGMTFNGGSLYVADHGHTIRRVDVATAAVTTVCGTRGVYGDVDGTGAAARLHGPSGVVADGLGNLYIADSDNETVRKVVLATGAVTTLAGASEKFGSVDDTGDAARFYQPVSVVAGGAGTLYVAEFGNAVIRQVSVATGQVTTLAGSARMYATTDGTGAAARFKGPAGIAFDGGNLYVTDSSDHVIRRIVAATGRVTTFAGTAAMMGGMDASGTAARFYSPRGIVTDDAGNLYVADTGNDTIRKVVIATGAVTTIAGTALSSGSTDARGAAARFTAPQDLALDNAGGLYVADTLNHTIRRVVLATGDVTTLAGSARLNGSADGTGTAARFDTPRGITTDGAGNAFVAEMRNAAIRKVTPGGVVTTIIGVPGRVGAKVGSLPAGLNQPIDVALLPSGELAICEGAEHAILIAGP